MSARSTWIVWRDGWRCELQAYGLDDALKTSGEIVHNSGRTTNPWTFETIGTGERTDPPFLLIQPDPEAVSHSRLVRRLGEHEVIVEDTPEAYRVGVLALTERCIEWAATRAAFAALPKPYVERFRSGKRKDEVKWSKHHTPERRAEIKRQLADIETAESRIDEAAARVDAALDALDEQRAGYFREWPTLVRETDWRDSEALMLLREQVTTACSALGEYAVHRHSSEGLPDHATLAWLREHEAKLDRELVKLDSIRCYGLAPGETIEILPGKYDGQISGQAKVVNALVREGRRQYGGKSYVDHLRTVEWQGDTYEINVERLQAITS